MKEKKVFKEFKVLEKEVKNNRTYITLEYLSCATDENKSV